MNLPENISKLFVIDKVFYGVDLENNSIRLSVIHNQMVKVMNWIQLGPTSFRLCHFQL